MEAFTEVFAWGNDHCGQLGLGGLIGKNYSTPRLCSFNVLIKEISCGEEHAGFISSQGHLYTMGSNAEGRLGIDDKSVLHSSSPCLVSKFSGLNPKKIACGWGHTAVVTGNGHVYVWGIGEFGALGLGNNITQWSPQKINLPEGFEAISASCGSRHTAVLSKSGKIAMMGCGEAGQLGTRRREKELFPVLLDAENIVQVACGIFHTAFLNSKGVVYTMGGNSFGQLGHSNKKSTSVPERVRGLDGVFIQKIACGGHSAAISDKGHLYIWGSSSLGEHLAPHKLNFSSRVKEISIGGTFTVVVLQDMSSYAWGDNSSGELGVSDFESKNAPSAISSLIGKKITKVACGGSFCIALGSDVKRSKTPTHIRSSSKVEYLTEHKKNYRKTEQNFKDFKHEGRYQYDQGKNEVDQLGLLKNSYLSLERNNQVIVMEKNKLVEENYLLMQRLQEGKTQVGEVSLLREENYRLKKMMEGADGKAYLECERLNRELDDERKRYQNEAFNRANLEKSYQLLSDENSKLASQIQSLYSEFSMIEQQLKYSKGEEMIRLSQEKETFHQHISAKDIEIERLTVSYHNLSVQHTRLVEENKIYHQSIIDLEEKNTKLFENLEHELAARAHDYKERTLNILEREGRRSISPMFHSVSPAKKHQSTHSEVITTKAISRTQLSESTQSKIGNTAARLLARMENDSVLANMRVSSPSRKSPERPLPFKAHQVSKDIREILKSRLNEYRQ